jgi:hypothetical protein
MVFNYDWALVLRGEYQMGERKHLIRGVSDDILRAALSDFTTSTELVALFGATSLSTVDPKSGATTTSNAPLEFRHFKRSAMIESILVLPGKDAHIRDLKTMIFKDLAEEEPKKKWSFPVCCFTSWISISRSGDRSYVLSPDCWNSGCRSLMEIN